MNTTYARSTHAFHATNEHNQFGCPFRNQSGVSAVKNFAAILASLSPDLHAAFASERAVRQAEFDEYAATYDSQT